MLCFENAQLQFLLEWSTIGLNDSFHPSLIKGLAPDVRADSPSVKKRVLRFYFCFVFFSPCLLKNSEKTGNLISTCLSLCNLFDFFFLFFQVLGMLEYIGFLLIEA